MSRSHLLTAAHMLYLPTDEWRDGKRRARVNMRLRSDILTRCYGPGLTCNYTSPADADTACLTAARTATGELGESLRDAQAHLRSAARYLHQLCSRQQLSNRDVAAEEVLIRVIQCEVRQAMKLHDQHGVANEAI
jgi:hypothetical protein